MTTLAALWRASENPTLSLYGAETTCTAAEITYDLIPDHYVSIGMSAQHMCESSSRLREYPRLFSLAFVLTKFVQIYMSGSVD